MWTILEKELQLLPTSSWKLIHGAECWGDDVHDEALCCGWQSTKCDWKGCLAGQQEADFTLEYVLRGDLKPTCWGWVEGIPLGSSLSHWLAREAPSTATMRLQRCSVSGQTQTTVFRVSALGLPNYRWFLWKPWPLKSLFFYRKRWISLSLFSSYSFLSLWWHLVW